METEGYGASRGRLDGLNEDAYLVSEGLGLYVVCDGASDRPAGELASATAVAALEDFVEEAKVGRCGSVRSMFSSYQVAAEAAHAALSAVLERARARPEYEGMATTISMLLMHGRQGTISHAGDSRVYLYRGGDCHQLTIDHELTRATGPSAGVQGDHSSGNDDRIDTFAVALRPGDTVLLCTDGAEEVIEERGVLAGAGISSPRALADRIVEAAQAKNPACDATVVVVRVLTEGDRDAVRLWLSAPPQPFELGHAVVYA